MTLALSGFHVVVCKKANVRHQVKTSVPNTDAVPGFLKTNKERLLANPAIWDIDFQSVAANFSLSSEEELVMKYNIGKDRQYNHTLLQSDCSTPITGIDITTNASTEAISGNDTYSLLILSNSIDKSNIANSSIWNATSSQIELCQKVQLYLNSTVTGGEDYVLAEDIREIDIGFDLSADFSTTGELGAATINDAKSNTTVASYVDACQCSVDSFDCINSPSALVPNTELIVCIYSTSSEVLIKTLESMIIKQKNSTTSLDVVTKGDVVFKSITSEKSVSNVNPAGGNGVRVTTRVPTNVFDFETAGTKIEVSGGLIMELAGSNTAGRKLVADVAAISDGNGDASFELEVSLQQQLDSQEDPVSSATSIAKKGSIVLGPMAFALVYAMW